MRFGTYELHEVLAGELRLDGGAMFGIVPRPLWERQIQPDSRNRIPLATRCLLIEGEGRLVLVDDGVGDKYDARFEDIYAVDRSKSDLASSLKKLGVGAEDITDVILTHLHFDHCGGSTVRNGEGRLRPTFPGARYHVLRAHWQWAHESPREQASFLPENLEPLEASGQLELHDSAGELMPGIEMIQVNGHTRGQQLVRLVDGNRSLLFAADLLPTAAHVPLLWVMAYDVAPIETITEKERILTLAAEEQWTIIFEHDVSNAAGVIERTEKGFRAADLRPTLE